MFDSLQTGLHSAFKSLRGKGKLTEANMRSGLKLVEESLLEADVSYAVVKDFMASVSEQAVGEKVLLSLQPDQQLVKIVNDELINLLGPVDEGLPLNEDVNIFMMCGLQGAGKTTTCGKLATYLQRNKVTPMLVAADLQRPAAIQQLHVIGETLGVPVYSEPGATDPVAVCQNAIKKAKAEHCKVVILDTAGRLAIDEELMNQLKMIDRKVQPHQCFLVVDGMTGQDAVNSAAAFNEALELNGVIMTKLDGDARGGALLSVKHVTGVPIKFIGTGEHFDSLEAFRPEGMASRILGMGDVVQLVDEAQKLVDENERIALEEKMAKGEFTLEDFRNQMIRFARPGLMQKMLRLMPGMGQLGAAMDEADPKQIRQLVGIIDSMTPAERKNPKIIDPSRRYRIAQGAGVQAQQVNDLVKQYEMMAPLFSGLANNSAGDRMKMVQDLQKQMMNPGGKLGGKLQKKSTGKRLTPKERAKMKKQREKFLKDKRKKKK